MLGSDETQAVLSSTLRQIHGTDARLEGWTAHPFLKRGKRRTTRYDLDARAGGEPHIRHFQWVGKFYERNDDAPKVATVLRELAATDCGARGGFVVPSVVACHDPCGLLLLTYETGESFSKATARNGPSVPAAIDARWRYCTPLPLRPTASPVPPPCWARCGDASRISAPGFRPRRRPCGAC